MGQQLLQPGQTLGKYEIVKELAIGGMAAIYLARVRGTAGFEKNVVLKSILPTLATDRHLVEMFLDEARLAATLRHSNIADVFDVGAEGSHYYFAMEYVHGENARTLRLAAKHKQLAIPVEVAIAITIGTAAALAYAHDRQGPEGALNIVHRDVSPTNILVGHEGAIKLVDFGIARASLRSSKTRTGMRKGKTPYLSPEQCRGLPIDRRSDLFSLGTVLYELTTPQRPFVGNSDFDVMEAIVAGRPPRPAQLVPGYPPELEQIVMRLLAGTPDARYQDANALLEDLEGFAQRRGILTSAHVVTRFMRELFEPATGMDRDTYTDFGAASAATREYPDGKPPLAALEPSSLRQLPDEEPTGAFRREMLWSPDRKVKFRPATSPGHVPAPPTATGGTTAVRQPLIVPSQSGDEPSQMSPFTEHTRQDVVVPFDPFAARTAELLAEIDDGAPEDETPDQRAYRRVDTLLHQAMALLRLGEPDKAVAAIELALDEGTTSTFAEELLQQHVETILEVYEAMLEDPYRTPTLNRPAAELSGEIMEERTRLLLPWIDGGTTIKEIITLSEMQRLEAYHHLCQLLMRGLLRL